MMDGREQDRVAAVVFSGLALAMSLMAFACSIVALVLALK